MVGIAGIAGMQIIISAVDRATGTMTRIGAQANAMAHQVEGANKRMLLSTKQMGMAFTAVGAGAAIATGLAVKSAMSFESEMTDALMMFGKVSADTRAEMEKVAISCSRDLGIPAAQSAKAFYYLGSAGLDTTTAIGTLPAVLKFARVGLIDTADAAEMTMTAMKVFGYEAKDSTRITDIFMEGVRNAQITTAELSESFKYVAPVAKQLGMSLEETTAVIGMLGDAGIRGSMAGTSLRRALLNLAAPTAQQKEMLDKLGVRVTDASGKFVGMASVLDQLNEATRGMGETEKAAAMKVLFGARAVAGMSAIMEMGGDRLKDYTAKLKDSSATSEMLADKKKDLRFQIEQLKAEFGALAIELGTVLIPILKDTLIPAIRKVVEWFSGLSPTMKKVIAIGGLLTAAIGLIVGPLLLLASPISVVIGLLIKLASTFYLLTGPIGLIVLAIGGLAVAWKMNLFGIQDKTKAVIDKIKGLFEKWKKIIFSMSGPFGLLKEAWDRNLFDIQGKTKWFVDKILSIIQPLIDGIKWLAEVTGIWKEQVDAVSESHEELAKTTKAANDEIVRSNELASKSYEKLTEAMPGAPAKAWGKYFTMKYTLGGREYTIAGTSQAAVLEALKAKGPGVKAIRIPSAQEGGLVTKGGLVQVHPDELIIPRKLRERPTTIIQNITVRTDEQARILRLNPNAWW